MDHQLKIGFALFCVLTYFFVPSNCAAQIYDTLPPASISVDSLGVSHGSSA